ncbi:MAG: hypothetical protein WC372_07360 [Candidatus Neomarinimicrobiota bacterium]
MSLSVKVRLEYDDTPRTPYITIHVRTDEGTGSVRSNYLTAFGEEHVVILEAPKGTVQLRTKTLKKRATRQERQRIEAIGGRRHSGSGSFAGNKSDGSTDRWRMENKFTTAESFRVTLADLTKLRSECRGFQAPVFNVEFQEKTGAVRETWVLVPAADWERLVHAQNA